MKSHFFAAAAARIGLVSALALAASTADAATLITFNFGNAFGSTPSSSFVSAGPPATTTYTFTSGGVTATATGFTYTQPIASFDPNTAALTQTAVTRTGIGLGVTEPGDGATPDQIDTNGPDEGLQIAFSGLAPGYRIVSATFGSVDPNDTFQLFGGTNAPGSFVRFGYSGDIDGNPALPSPLTGSNGPGGRTINFNNSIGGYNRYIFTTNVAEPSGYSLRSLTIAAVPEPATWAMMIAGFGMIGAAMRRRRGARPSFA